MHTTETRGMETRARWLFATMASALLASSALAQDVDRTLEAEPDGEVDIENVAGSVEVIGWDRNEVQVVGELGRNVERLDFEVDGDRTIVHVVLPRRVRNVGSTDLEIHVPKGSRIYAETVSADIDVRDVDGDLRLKAVSGHVLIEGAPARVRAETVSGDIELDADTGDLELNTVSGDVTVLRARGDIEAASVSGDVRIEGKASFTNADFSSVSGRIEFQGEIGGDGDFEFESHSGNVVLTLSGEVNAEVDISTFSGSIESEFGERERRRRRHGPGDELSMVLGDGSARLSISTFSGSVDLVQAR